MTVRFKSEYRLKFYLNAHHYIILDGCRGETHSHTWELCLEIEVPHRDFVRFDSFEKAVTEYLRPYQNTQLNDIAPFDTILPTLENLVDCFMEGLSPVIRNFGGKLMSIEGSEGPTRSFIIHADPDSFDDETTPETGIDSAIDAVVERLTR